MFLLNVSGQHIVANAIFNAQLLVFGALCESILLWFYIDKVVTFVCT